MKRKEKTFWTHGRDRIPLRKLNGWTQNTSPPPLKSIEPALVQSELKMKLPKILSKV